MSQDWTAQLARWAEAGVIDSETAERIRRFEASQGATAGLRWPVLIAIGFGALMIACGVLLFVAANWDTLSPATRFALVVFLTAVFHAAGAFTIDRFHAMGVTFHAIGTVALGAGIALAGQIFNLNEHWPAGVMLWALGAGIGWGLLRQVPQMILFAVLAPAWLVSEWLVAAAQHARRSAVVRRGRRRPPARPGVLHESRTAGGASQPACPADNGRRGPPAGGDSHRDDVGGRLAGV